jgi:hypothetical protein
VDSGVDYRLEPARSPSVEVAGEIRYGRSADVPSFLDAPATTAATLLVLAGPNGSASTETLAALDAAASADVDVVVVADAVDVPRTRYEVIRTSAALGAGAALNIGVRRARGDAVIVLDRLALPSGDVVSPLVQQLADPSVAVVGGVGFVSADMNRFDDVTPTAGPVDIVAVHGTLAFRRADAAARGPVDEAFRVGTWLDAWWSLVLRDEGEGVRPRRAVALPGLPLRRLAARAAVDDAGPDDERLARRNI